MKYLFSSFSLLLSCFAFSQANIGDARNMSVGSTVTVTGVVTNGPELGNIRYIQDATGAIPAYGSMLSSVSLGDSITATGDLFDFNGLLEISPTTNFTNHGQGTLPQPLNIPLPSAGESIESQLVRVDNISFVQTGSFSSGNSTVQVTDGTNTLDVRINGGTNISGASIPTGQISMIALMGQYGSNYQLVPRSLSDIFPYVAPDKEINIKLDGIDILNNTSYFIGNNATTQLIVENSGTQNLSVSGTSFSGANAIDFSTNLSTATISGGTSDTFNILFNPSGNGSYFATINITNDDVDENPYVINLSAIGLNNLATEPSNNPSNLNFPLVKTYTLVGDYDAVSSAENYIVLWGNGNAIMDEPLDGTSYKRGDIIGTSKVAYVGSGTSFTPRGIIANQTYYFKVFTFNGSNGYENYNTTSPASGSASSLGSQMGTYYNSISTSSPTFLSDLSALINPHNSITYFSYKQTMMSQFEIKDTTNGQSYVECVYTGERKVFDDPFDWTATGYSREHTFAHSWMPSYPANSPELPEYNDQHNLFPANLSNANSPRSNLPLENITGNVVFNYLEGSVGYNGQQLVYEPRDSHKGNAARAIFYMATCYNGQSNQNWQIPGNQSQESLKSWHFNDLPDNQEIARHEYIVDLQNNRNPFIDSVNFACYIDFSNMAYLPDGCLTNISEYLSNNLSVFPVPASGKIYAQINGLKIKKYKITNIQGKVINEEKVNALPLLVLNTNNMNNGVYILELNTSMGVVKSRFIVQK